MWLVPVFFPSTLVGRGGLWYGRYLWIEPSHHLLPTTGIGLELTTVIRHTCLQMESAT